MENSHVGERRWLAQRFKPYEDLNERQFVECTKKGDHTIFTVTAEETDRLWEFDLENNTMQGHWRGVFLAKGKETELDFTEQIHCKKLILRVPRRKTGLPGGRCGWIASTIFR